MGMIDGVARIGRVLDHAIDKFIGVILETRKGYNQTIYLYNVSGDDSVPCKNDKVIILKIDGTGNFIGAGVLIESQEAKPGEKIFFARDPDANIVSKIKMLNDGSVLLDTDTETTDDATGNYSRTIKGVTDILEKDGRNYTNEKDVTNTIKGAVSETIEKDLTQTVKGAVSETIEKEKSSKIKGDYNLASDKSVNIKSGVAIVNEAAQTNEIKAGTEVILAAPGAAAWCPNGITACPWGMPHGGTLMGITGLKGK